MKTAASFLLLLSLMGCTKLGPNHYALNVPHWLRPGPVSALHDIPADSVIQAEDVVVDRKLCAAWWGTRHACQNVVGHKARHAIPFPQQIIPWRDLY